MPEIQRVKLIAPVLQLKAMGIDDPLTFDFMDRPPSGACQCPLFVWYLIDHPDFLKGIA